MYVSQNDPHMTDMFHMEHQYNNSSIHKLFMKTNIHINKFSMPILGILYHIMASSIISNIDNTLSNNCSTFQAHISPHQMPIVPRQMQIDQKIHFAEPVNY